jgi:hypothetical protein
LSGSLGYDVAGLAVARSRVGDRDGRKKGLASVDGGARREPTACLARLLRLGVPRHQQLAAVIHGECREPKVETAVWCEAPPDRDRG